MPNARGTYADREVYRKTISKINAHQLSLDERFFAFTVKTNSCWNWMGHLTRGSIGYGRIKTVGRKNVLVHRYSYEKSNGKIPKGLSVLHKCDNTRCVNP